MRLYIYVLSVNKLTRDWPFDRFLKCCFTSYRDVLFILRRYQPPRTVLIRHLLWLQKFFVKIKTDQQHFCINGDAFITILTLQLTRPSYEKLIFLTIIFDWDFSIFLLSRIFINFKRNTFKHIFTLFLPQSFNFGFIFFFIHYLFFFRQRWPYQRDRYKVWLTTHLYLSAKILLLFFFC